MAEEPKQPGRITPLRSSLAPVQYEKSKEDQVLCERCGAEMYRMHAVWRCAGCGFKMDRCGW